MRHCGAEAQRHKENCSNERDHPCLLARRAKTPNMPFPEFVSKVETEDDPEKFRSKMPDGSFAETQLTMKASEGL